MPVTETRDSGIEVLDTDVDLSEDADGVVFRTEEPVEIQVGESAGHPVYVTASHFVAASVDTELDEQTQMITGQERVDESSVFVSNEDGELGGGFLKVDGGDVEDAIEAFEDDHL